MALIFLFLYAPILLLVVFSFNDANSNVVWQGFSLRWYEELFRDRQVMGAVYNTLLVSVLATAISTVVGTFTAAVGLYGMRRRWRDPILTVNNIPLTNADIITGVSMMLLFVAAATILGTSNTFGFGTLLIAHVTFDLPYVILSVMPRFKTLDSSLSEAAQDLGATPMQGFFKVILPDIMPGVFSGFVMALTMSIDDFVVSFFTTGSGVSNLSITIYTMAKRGISPKINALSTIIFACVFVLLIGLNLRDFRKDGRGQKKLDGVKIPY